MRIFTGRPIFTITVNNGELVKIEGDFEAEALRILRQTPGIAVVERPPQLSDRGVDAILQFAGKTTEIAVEIKRQANAALAWQLVHYANEEPGRPILLIADRTTAEARQILQRHGIAILDGLGNAHIELPGLLFHLEGNETPRAGAEAPPTRLRGKAGVAAQALLLQPKRRWQVTDLADKAGISKALAHRVLTRLEKDGIVETTGKGPQRFRRVFDVTALLDLWVEESLDRLTRRRAYLLAQSPRQVIDNIGKRLSQTNLEYALTGAAAASLIAPFVSAVPIVDLWIQETADIEEVFTVLGAEAVTEGHNLVLMQSKDDVALAFRQKQDGIWLPNKFRLYADLVRDPRRGAEQAAHLREELIGF